MFSLTTGSNCWIGINDIDINSTYIWADGSESTYRRWNSGEPSNGNEDCGEIITSGYWNDQPCTHANLCYLCSSIGKFMSIYILFGTYKPMIIHLFINRENWTVLVRNG